MASVAHNLGDRWTGEQPALRARLAGSQRLIIRIRQIRILWMELAIARQVGGQQKSLEKPTGVSKMPLGRTRVRHRLYGHILGIQRSHQRFAVATQSPVLIHQRAIETAAELYGSELAR